MQVNLIDFFNSELKQVLCRYIFSQKKFERYLEISETNNYILHVDYNDYTYILAFLKYEIHTVPIIMPLKIVRAHHDYSNSQMAIKALSDIN